MIEKKLNQLIAQITPADEVAINRATRRWDSIAKPLHGLGLLEDAVVQMAGVMGTDDVFVTRKTVVVFCADNGVVAEGVTQTGQEVTAAVAEAMARRESCVCRMAQLCGADILPVDIGVSTDVKETDITVKKFRYGTDNLAVGPAMSREDGARSVLIGLELALELAERGVQLLATGEMGIGNTTTAAAVAAVLLDLPVETVTGRGAGLSDAGLQRKREVIAQAIAINEPNPADALDVLSKVGGLDIGGMAGLCLGGALAGVPVLLDGAISCAAACLAVQLCPNSKKALIASHRSGEPVGGILLDQLGLHPLIDAGLHLGEGTGAVAAMPMLDMALSVYHGMSTFDGMGIESYQKLS